MSNTYRDNIFYSRICGIANFYRMNHIIVNFFIEFVSQRIFIWRKLKLKVLTMFSIIERKEPFKK